MVARQINKSKITRWRQRLSREAGSVTKSLRPRLQFWVACANFLPDFALAGLRARFYRWGGCDVGDATALLGRLALLGDGAIAARLKIGEGSLIAPNVTFGLDGPITIGRNVSVSPHVTLYTATHALGFGSRRMNLAVTPKPIVVEDGVWIGMHSLILPGVTLGQGCVVSAGSVVTQDVPSNTLVAGNPATVQKQLPFGNR